MWQTVRHPDSSYSSNSRYNYYNKFGKTEFVKVMNYLNMVLAYWVRRKYKRFHRKPIVKAFIWLQEIASKDRSLFYHWQRGQTPRLCLCTKSWVWRAVWGETFTHGSVRGWGWNSLALLDLWPFLWPLDVFQHEIRVLYWQKRVGKFRKLVVFHFVVHFSYQSCKFLQINHYICKVNYLLKAPMGGMRV